MREPRALVTLIHCFKKKYFTTYGVKSKLRAKFVTCVWSFNLSLTRRELHHPSVGAAVGVVASVARALQDVASFACCRHLISCANLSLALLVSCTTGRDSVTCTIQGPN